MSVCKECNLMDSNKQWDGDWYVYRVEGDKKIPIESSKCEHLAAKAKQVFDDHEKRNGRNTVYVVEQKVAGSDR